MTPPLFSLISPTFQSGAKLAATVASVLAQEEGLYEYLVIDGGSRDGTVDYLRTLEPAVRWVSEPDAGIYDAMNKGIRFSSGQFLYFLGAGDHLRPDILRIVADRVPPADGRLRMLYGDVHWPGRGGKYGGVFDANRLAYLNICHQAIFYERGIFDLLGEYEIYYSTCADYALNIRCFGRPEVRPTHLDLIVADYEGAGASTAIDPAFYADHRALIWRHLGAGAALRQAYHHSDHLAWARRIGYHLKQPWRQLPKRLWRRLRHLPTNAR